MTVDGGWSEEEGGRGLVFSCQRGLGVCVRGVD